MAVGRMTRQRAGPKQRTMLRRQGFHHPHDAALDQRLKMRHFARIEERMDHLPVGCIPSDQDNFIVQGLACLVDCLTATFHERQARRAQGEQRERRRFRSCGGSTGGVANGNGISG